MTLVAFLPWNHTGLCFLLLVSTALTANMASGVKVADETTELFLEMKKSTQGDERIRLATFVIRGGEIVKELVIREGELHQGCQTQVETQNWFKKFIELLESQTCRYILYDCHYETKESPKEDLLFFLWCAENAKIKDKMHYASSKSSLKNVFIGVKCDVTLNDLDCKCMATFADVVLRKSVKSIEGHMVRD